MEREDRQAAERHLERSLAIDPRNPDVHYNLGLLQEEFLDDPEAALAHYREYLELGGDRRFRVGMRIRRLEQKGEIR
jgi:tetratricopeptide (TPR) repeat protein